MKKLALCLTVILCLCCLASCKLLHSTLNIVEHTYEYIQYETGHFKQYTCGCPSPDILGLHLDTDENGACDVCGYAMKIGGAFEFEYVASEEGHCEHKIGTTCDGTCTKSPHEDKDNDSQCDYCKYLLDSSLLAQIVLDYEQSLRDEIDRLHAEHPEFNYYYHPVDDVYCYFVLDSEASADAIIKKYDMKNLFANADVSALNAIKMIGVTFDRDEFTEEMHQRIKEISENEELIESISYDMYSDWDQSYMPKIEYYTDDASVLEYERAPYILGFENARDIIIKSKAEYDAYLDELLETAESDYQKERINSAKDIYDESFFEENALLLTRMVVRGSGSIQLTVNNLYISDNKIYVVIRTDEPTWGTCDMQFAFFAFAVDKDDVVNVNEVVTLE